MNWMIASDLHGSALYTQALLEAYRRENCERLVLLGDILYHGPRNDLPEGYAPKTVISLLNPLAGQIFCVYGESNPPKLSKGDILLCGHTHVPANTDHEDFTYWNPGSVSIPKNNSARGYMLLTEKTVCWKDLTGKPLQDI